jgi:hypothetical protein
VIERLQRAELTATAVQNPLTSLADDVAHTRRILALDDGPGIPADQTRRGRTQGVRRQTGRTFSACGPFCPWVVSNSTFWFSSSDR